MSPSFSFLLASAANGCANILVNLVNWIERKEVYLRTLISTPCFEAVNEPIQFKEELFTE